MAPVEVFKADHPRHISFKNSASKLPLFQKMEKQSSVPFFSVLESPRKAEDTSDEIDSELRNLYVNDKQSKSPSTINDEMVFVSSSISLRNGMHNSLSVVIPTVSGNNTSDNSSSNNNSANYNLVHSPRSYDIPSSPTSTPVSALFGLNSPYAITTTSPPSPLSSPSSSSPFSSSA